MSESKVVRVRSVKTKAAKKAAKLSLLKELSVTLNRACAENESNTSDFILAEYLLGCLEAYNKAVKKRDEWYGVHLEPGNSHLVGRKSPLASPITK